jgi:Cdc6-like AAA superfamily ATPase
MSLRDKMSPRVSTDTQALYARFGVFENPYPTASQNTGNPHYPLAADIEAEDRLADFLNHGRSQVLVVVGTQGVGKTNFLNYLEEQLLDIREDYDESLVVRYLADPEPSFDGIIRAILQELGPDHLQGLGKRISADSKILDVVKSLDLRSALIALSKRPDDEDVQQYAMQWLLGFRLVNAHRSALGVNFRLDTVESRTSVLRDYVNASIAAGLVKGVVLLLDELEKQAGVMGPTAVVRYLSAMRAIIDALPRGLFMVIAITPDAMRRYSSALPAFRSRLENRIELLPLSSLTEATHLAKFYEDDARQKAKKAKGGKPGTNSVLDADDLRREYAAAEANSKQLGSEGVRQREFLNRLHKLAEKKMKSLV